MELNTHFIPQNVAAAKAHQIGVYRKGKKIGYVPIDGLVYPDVGKKLYSFGAISDIHLGNTDADTDFQRALTYFSASENVAFTCICGDLTNTGTASEYEHYKDMVDAYSPDTPVYAVAGNHDATDKYDGSTPALTLTDDGITPYTGKPLYYTFSQNDDLYVMMGLRRWDYGYSNEDIFSTEELQWLYDTLEANRDKRCFVFQHALRADGSGWPYAGTWPTVKLLEAGAPGMVFKSLVSHYPNAIWFHGHSHTAFDSQEDNPIANYDKNFGCHSIHIPSLAKPREYEGSAYVSMTAESEGYVVDVYENHIVLRGRDFANGKFLPITTYCLDTTFTPVEAGMYTDSTGTIVT